MPPIPKPQVVKATKGASPDLTMLDKASSRHGDEFLLQQGPDGLEDFLSEATSLADEFSEVSEADVQQQQPSPPPPTLEPQHAAPQPLIPWEMAEASGKNVARIRVIVRKRPINKQEIQHKENDIVTIADDRPGLIIHEPKMKVDLTKYTEKHQLSFDDVLDQGVDNDQDYRSTVQPLVWTIFQQAKATCFAYGQTGSGKTYTMTPLPKRAAEEMLNLLESYPQFSEWGLWLSCFEIYGGKLFDLLNERRKLVAREDGSQNVCIVGLQEYRVTSMDRLTSLIDKANSVRSTGSTGANAGTFHVHALGRECRCSVCSKPGLYSRRFFTVPFNTAANCQAAKAS